MSSQRKAATSARHSSKISRSSPRRGNKATHPPFRVKQGPVRCALTAICLAFFASSQLHRPRHESLLRDKNEITKTTAKNGDATLEHQHLNVTTTNDRSPASVSSKVGLPGIFKKISGANWTVWSPIINDGVLFDHLDIECEWTPFRANYALDTTQVQMCTHPKAADIWVSGEIQRVGRWGECDHLTNWWKYNITNNPQHSSRSSTGSEPLYYLDMGANIGSCVMQMLLSTNATIVAFEPDPRNLFVLTSTLRALPLDDWKRRVFVVPVGLGSSRSTSTIHVSAVNRGNAVVGKPIADRGEAMPRFLEPVIIPVERVDDILDGNRNNIRLIKLDTQGSECYIVEGMTNVLERTHAVHYELEPHLLRSFTGCSEQILYQQFVTAGFDMHDDKLEPGMEPKRISTLPFVGDARNMVAVKRKASP